MSCIRVPQKPAMLLAAARPVRVAAVFLLAFALVLSLSGCSNKEPTVSDPRQGRVVVQVNETTCEEAGGGTSSALDGEIGDTETNAKKTYDVLKEMGFSDENIAGVLGNWATESGIDPSGVEGIFDEPFQLGPKKKAAMDDHENYTLNTLFPMYAGRISINKQAYIGDDGKYYPGIGLAGFTGPACTRLLKYAEKFSTAWYSFDLQLSFSIVDSSEGYGRGEFWKNWGAESSPESAAETFLAKYEGCPGMMLAERQTHAREWYEKIKNWNPDSSYAKSILNMKDGGSLPSPSGNSTASSTSAIDSSTGEVVGGDVAEQCWNFLKAAGMSDEAAAGVMGNFEAESGMNPANIQGNGAGPAAGLFQMEQYNVSGTRWGQMRDHAASKGKDWTDLGSQLEFLEQDAPGQFNLYTGHGTYTYANGTVTWWPEAMTWDEFKKHDDIDKATEIFMRVFERPSIPHLDRRIASAREYYERFKGTGATAQSETAEECEEDGKQKFGSSGITNGDEYIQFQGTHYDNGTESGGTDSGAMNSACGATSFTIGVNMLLGEVHKFCGVETWKDMGSNSTTIGWGSDKAQKWLEKQNLTNEIEITGNNSVQSKDDLLKALQEGNVVVASSKGNVFKNKDGSTRHSNGHYILFYKYENSKFYADDCGNRKAGGGVEYSEEDVKNFFESPSRNGGGSLSFKRK